MNLSHETIPVQTLHLFPVLDQMLIDLLESLTDEEWQAQTIARLWRVKDVAAHLLDGNLRTLSMSRDSYFGVQPGQIESYRDLVSFLNRLNMDWTHAAKRLSPKVLVDLLKSTGPQFCDHLKTLDLFGPALFSVAWAGEEVSLNWFHIAREYTEKFLHQQQIRDAVGKQGLMTQALFYPFMNTLMYGLPHAYRDVAAEEGTTVNVHLTGELTGSWTIVKTTGGWQFTKPVADPDATVGIDPYDAWRLFSKSMRPADVRERVLIEGDQRLGGQALEMVAFMA